LPVVQRCIPNPGRCASPLAKASTSVHGFAAASGPSPETPATADLAIERFDNGQVLIKRTDTGISLGLTAVYTGKRNGHRIEGQAVYTWPEKWPEPKKGTFSATIDEASEAALTPPSTFRGLFPDLSGNWRLEPATTGGHESGLAVAVVQNDADVNMVLLVGGQPRTFSYRGHFESATLISGQTCNSSLDKDYPHCLLESSPTAVLSSSLIRDNDGDELEKVAGRDDPRYTQALCLVPVKNAKSYIPDQPFDLTGTWQSSTPQGPPIRIAIKQSNGLVDMWGPFGGHPFFTGWYFHNPVAGGTALARSSTQNNIAWSAATLFVYNPDTLQMTSEGNVAVVFRVSAPPPHDILCDAQNTYHIDRFHAWVRGYVAMSAKDSDATRCWLA